MNGDGGRQWHWLGHSDAWLAIYPLYLWLAELATQWILCILKLLNCDKSILSSRLNYTVLPAAVTCIANWFWTEENKCTLTFCDPSSGMTTCALFYICTFLSINVAVVAIAAGAGCKSRWYRTQAWSTELANVTSSPAQYYYYSLLSTTITPSSVLQLLPPQAGKKCQGSPADPQSLPAPESEPSEVVSCENEESTLPSPLPQSSAANVVVEDESALLMARLTSNTDTDPTPLTNEGDFFQSLQLAARPQQETGAGMKEVSSSRLEDLSFFESIGLYWVNPADRTERAPEGLSESQKSPAVEELTDDNHVSQCLTEEVQMGDFLHELGLTPVGESSRRWRLWQPNGVEDLVGELLPQLYLPNSETTDPTLMEDRTQCLLQPKPRPDEVAATEVDQSNHPPIGDLYCQACHRSLATPELFARHNLLFVY